MFAVSNVTMWIMSPAFTAQSAAALLTDPIIHVRCAIASLSHPLRRLSSDHIPMRRPRSSTANTNNNWPSLERLLSRKNDRSIQDQKILKIQSTDYFYAYIINSHLFLGKQYDEKVTNTRFQKREQKKTQEKISFKYSFKSRIQNVTYLLNFNVLKFNFPGFSQILLFMHFFVIQQTKLSIIAFSPRNIVSLLFLKLILYFQFFLFKKEERIQSQIGLEVGFRRPVLINLKLSNGAIEMKHQKQINSDQKTSSIRDQNIMVLDWLYGVGFPDNLKLNYIFSLQHHSLQTQIIFENIICINNII